MQHTGPIKSVHPQSLKVWSPPYFSWLKFISTFLRFQKSSRPILDKKLQSSEAISDFTKKSHQLVHHNISSLYFQIKRQQIFVGFSKLILSKIFCLEKETALPQGLLFFSNNVVVKVLSLGIKAKTHALKPINEKPRHNPSWPPTFPINDIPVIAQHSLKTSFWIP